MIGFTLLMALVLACIPCHATLAIIQPGEPSPPFELKDPQGMPHSMNESTSQPMMLVFTKPFDRHTSTALLGITSILRGDPRLEHGIESYLIISRYEHLDETSATLERLPKGWIALLDPDDRVYKGYKIIATPSVILVGADRRVAGVHPGYDPAMVQDIRLELAKMLNVEVTSATLGQAEKPNMNLQMGRQMARRKLWEQALDYYARANAEGKVADAERLEIAQIYLGMNQPEDALKILEAIPLDSSVASQIPSLVQRARELQTMKTNPANPPEVR